jgi:hypothetical protein
MEISASRAVAFILSGDFICFQENALQKSTLAEQGAIL